MKVDLQELIKAAKRNYKSTRRRFEKYDNSEDLHAMEGWQQTISWLEWWGKENG